MDLLWWPWMIAGAICAAAIVKRALLRLNGFIYEAPLGEKRHELPPGDLGWPLIGNMLSFLRAFKSPHPDSFITDFVTRFGRTGIYKLMMFGKPSIVVTSPESCRRVLTDDEAFKPGWPAATVALMGKNSFIGISEEEHKRLRRLTSAPINGHDSLSVYLTYIEQSVKISLTQWVDMGQIEFLTELRKLTFRIITHIFLSSESGEVETALEKEYTSLNYGVRAMAINLPGFAYHRAIKARRKLVGVFGSILEKRRLRSTDSVRSRDMVDALMNVEDDNGRKLTDEEIIDVLLMYMNAGHESSGHITMWATVLLQEHPQFLAKARAEQEEIVKNRPPSQKGLSLQEVRQMNYLSNVIDETLRLVTFSLVVFREAKKDVRINGYMIPQGWRVLVWFRSVHLDPETYSDPGIFDPERWEGFTPKAGSFLPFGGGTRLCPGNDLAKLEISVFLHYFLLGYRVERVNPGCPVRYLPHTRPVDNCLAFVRRV